MSAAVSVHPCAHFADLMAEVVAALPHPQSVDVEINGCKARLRCSSKAAWIQARHALRKLGSPLCVRGWAVRGRYGLAVAVRGVTA